MKNIDDKIIQFLKDGLTQLEISIKLQEENIRPNSLSSVEKKIKNIRESYGAKTLFHLGYILSKKP
ncbi:MAG: hypothetical protein K0R36_526 [Chryseobacterium sp.]|jgi:hypothetical protein|nr:hypothetical protein [Chryseobacterium sp.]